MPKCDCEKDKCLSPAVLQINNHDCPTLFHKVIVPAAMGDDETNPPRNGQYRNVLLVYEANGHVYMFSSDGIPTLLSGSSQGVDDYDDLTNKPSIEGHELVGDSSLEDIGVTDAIQNALEDYTPTSELAEVAFTGDYDDLTGTPTIPVVNDATLTITRNGASAGTFTANSANNTTIDIAVPTATSDLTNDSGFITNTVNDLVNYYTKTETDSAIGEETTNREDADQDLQEQIDALASASDVVDVVGTYADLQNYDTSHLNNNDIIKVLTDETHNDAISYYRWNTATSTFSYVGSQGPFYTKSESDATFVPQTRTVNNKALSSDITLTAADVGALPDTTVIPTVNDATLTIQKEGSSIGTFTANSATNTTVNIVETDPTVPSWAKQPTKPTYSYSEITNKPTIPTKTSDLTNDGEDGTSTYVEADDLAAVATSGSYNDLTNKPTIPAAQVNSDWDASSGVAQILNKPTLATVATSGSYNDLSNKPTIPTVNNATLTIQKEGTSVGTFTANASTNSTVNIIETDPTVPAWAKASSKPSYSWTEITNKPTIPTKTSDLTNDSGFITNSVNNLTNYYKKSDTYTQAEVNSLINALPPVPTKTSDLVNDGEDGTAEYLEDDETAYQTASIPYGACDGTSTATAFTATVPGITELRDGVCMWLKNGVVTSASGFTININNLGAKPVYSNMAAASAETTMFNVNYTMFFVYDSTRVTGGCWVLYRGYNANDDYRAYQMRTNSSTLPMKSVTYRYRLLFTSGDGKSFVPATNSSSTNTTDSRTVCQDKINPFGSIFYYGTTAQVNANARPGASSLWQQYTISLGYSFNRTGAALTLTQWKPVYVKAAPQTDGSAIIDSTTPYVQDLPTTEDGKIYIFLGVAYSATNIELLYNHPVYYYKDGMIRPYTEQITYSNATTSTAGLMSASDKSKLDGIESGAVSGSIVKANGDTLGTTTIDSTTANYMEVTKLTTATDLNTLRTTGIYIVGASGNTNAPTSNWGTIFVDWTVGTKYQMYIPDGDNTTVYKRKYASSTWGSWVPMDKVKYTAYNISPASDTTAAWKTALGGEGTYFTWYNTASKFTNQPNQYGFLRTIIGANDIRQDWWTQTGGSHYYRTGNGTGWYSSASDAGAFRNITVNNGTLTIQKNGTNVQTFTANQSSNVTANITVPTNLSDLYNDMGFASYSAGDHIDITNDVISAVDYVHSENPVSTSAVTPIVTGSMITNGTITADKLATGATIQLTLSTTDIGEGAALAANTLYGVYQ